MDLSQHWETLVSIILGIALADVLMHLHELIHARNRVEWDALPLVWTLIGVLWLFNYWWAVGLGLDGAPKVRVAGGYVLLAIPPILLFVMATSALPRRVPEHGTVSLRDEWAKNRSVFLPVLGLNQIAAWIVVSFGRDGIVFDFPALLRSVTLALVIAMLLVKSRRFEWFAALVILALGIARISTQVVR
ncbi:MAG TPA: hypothetical protein VI258_01430 [Rhodanobacteraceae bacterium]